MSSIDRQARDEAYGVQSLQLKIRRKTHYVRMLSPAPLYS